MGDYCHRYARPRTGCIVHGNTFYSAQDRPELPEWPVDEPFHVGRPYGMYQAELAGRPLFDWINDIEPAKFSAWMDEHPYAFDLDELKALLPTDHPLLHREALLALAGAWESPLPDEKTIAARFEHEEKKGFEFL